jgi:hypothetical protein
MDTSLIPNLLDVSLCLVTLFISVRSFDLYARLRPYRIFILGLSMALVSLSAAADFISSYVKVIHLNTDWFLYIGQAIGFLFIALSLVQSSDRYLRDLMRLNIVAFPFLLILLLLSPVLPNISDTSTQTLLAFPRLIICILILCGYFSAYTSKPTRFSLFMTTSFFFFTADYLMTLGQNLVSSANQLIFRDLGDIAGVIAVIVLVVAVSTD